MAVKYQIVSPQSNRPVMSVIQDALLGAFLLTAPGVVLDRTTMMHCVLCIPDWNGQFEQKDRYTGHDLVSMVLPVVNWSRRGVVIRHGVLVEGQLTKDTLGTSHGSLIHVIYNDCGPDETILFIHRLQMITHAWLDMNGFTIGVTDVMTTPERSAIVKQEVAASFRDVAGLDDEMRINQRLNQCRDVTGRVVKEPLDERNGFFCTVKAGSKGSLPNIGQCMASVGQQNLSGKRIPYTWTGRTLPHFKRGSNGPAERGFIQHSYCEGLDPHEVWWASISGREGIIDTACKTSTTGYLERRLMKAMENLSVRWDGSVRNSDGMLLQFAYGDDGFDPTKVEKQFVDYGRYGHYATEDADSEYEQLQRDKEFLDSLDAWKDPGLRGTNAFMLPINVSRIVLNATTLFDMPSDALTRTEVMDMVSELVQSIDNEMLQGLIRYELYSLPLVMEKKITRDNMEVIVHEIKRQYERVRACKGESVGAIGAQSIGEPATQMTLNTFHFAGISSMNVTLGIPRLEEILNATKGDKMKTPLTTMYAADMLGIVKQLKHVRVEDVVESYKITDTPDETEVADFFLFPDSFYKPGDFQSTLVMYLAPYSDVIAVRDVIYATGRLVCAYTDGTHPIVHVKSGPLELDLDLFYDQTLKGTTLHGIPGAEYAKVATLPGKPPCIQTSLSNLSQLFELDVDVTSIYTNNIEEVANTLGIEAARFTLIKEIRGILSYYGIYVNVRHILLLVDWITNTGRLVPLTRHGIRQVDASPLKRCTFEEVVEVFSQAAVNNEKDTLTGISECIIAGVPPNIGTKNVQCEVDDAMVEKYAVPRPKAWENPEEVFEDMDNMDPWNDSSTHVPPSLYGFNPSCTQPEGIFGFGQGIQPSAFGTPGYFPQPTPAFGTPGYFPQPPPAFGTPGYFPQPTPVFGTPGLSNVFAQPIDVFNQPNDESVQLPVFGAPSLPVYNPIEAKPTFPVYNSNCAPPSPRYSPTSPVYDPNCAPLSPTSPRYSPTSPMYSPTSPMYSPTSPVYDPNCAPLSPTSPRYSPTSPMYSPTSPAYDPMNAPQSPMYSPTSPAYDPTRNHVSETGSFGGVCASSSVRKRKTYLE